MKLNMHSTSAVAEITGLYTLLNNNEIHVHADCVVFYRKHQQ